ncbi:MAG: hypothetical protein JWM95_1922 [Gemmatimonadetes bacterium]|nr:hypothetical protein [Gemmatimonadota bacterium]
MIARSFPLYRSLVFVMGVALGTTVRAQSIVPSGERTRSQLEARLRAADSLHRTDEAFHLRSRLRNGDFEVGDRVILSFDGVGLQRSDTLLVQAQKLLRLGEPMGDLRLDGVLRSELADSVSSRVAKYFKNIVIRVVPLIRVSITGAVRAPGFYYARPDMPLGDVIMRSGGQDQAADLDNSVVKRGASVLWTAEDVRAALRDGVTLEGLNMDPGDEIVVGNKNSSSFWPKAAQYGLPILSAVLLQLLIRR